MASGCDIWVIWSAQPDEGFGICPPLIFAEPAVTKTAASIAVASILIKVPDEPGVIMLLPAKSVQGVGRYIFGSLLPGGDYVTGGESRQGKRQIDQFAFARAGSSRMTSKTTSGKTKAPHLPIGEGFRRGDILVGVSKTFYIETFGCQMNAHDSEKVIGTLEQQGYARVEDEGEAGLILYNTCSIRDKAEQKVFHRLNEYKRLQGEGKKFAVLGCVAQQEGEKIFEKAPYVSLVAGSASLSEFAGDAAAAGGGGAEDYGAR